VKTNRPKWAGESGQKRLRLFLLALSTAFVLGTGPVSDAAQSTAYYQSYFDKEYGANSSRFNSMVNSGDSVDYYYFAQVLDGTTCMYEATGDLAYLERALKWAETMVSKAAIIDRDGKKNWKGDYVYGSVSVSYLHHEFVAGMEMLRLARLIITDAGLNGGYGPRAQTVYQFVKTHIVDKQIYTRGNLYWFENDAADYGSALSAKTANLARLCLYIYQIGGDAKYRDLGDTFAQSFKERLQPYGGGLVWDLGYNEDDDSYPAPDTAHANRHPYMAVEFYRAGRAITLNDLNGLAALLSNKIWNQSYSDPRFTNFIDGSNTTYLSRGAWANGYIVSGWMNLGEVAPEVQAIGDAVLEGIIAGVRNPSLDYMNHDRGRTQLVGHLAKNLALNTSPPPTPEPTPTPEPSPTPDPIPTDPGITDPVPIEEPIATLPAPPAEPELIFPGNGEKVPTSVSFKWKKSKDPNGDPVTYGLKLCKDSSLTDCTTHNIFARGNPLYYAGLGGSLSGLLFLTIFIAGGMRKKRMLLVSILLLSVLLISCGGGGAADDSPAVPGEVSYFVSGLSSSTTYYWQVTADDGNQGISTSEVRGFVTE